MKLIQQLKIAEREFAEQASGSDQTPDRWEQARQEALKARWKRTVRPMQVEDHEKKI